MNSTSSSFAPDDTIIACASAAGAEQAILRLSGAESKLRAAQAGIPIPQEPWTATDTIWSIGSTDIPCRVLLAAAPRSFTGYDCLEICIPAAPAVIEFCLHHCHQQQIQAAGPGAFCRQALANKRMHLDQAEAILALTQASDIAATQDALARLRGALSAEIEPMRQRLIHLRAQVEVGLDFLEEDDVRAYDPAVLAGLLQDLKRLIQKWQRAAVSVGSDPLVCLVGRANAGKSALFQALCGADVLISEQAGTTRDFLQEDWDCHGRRVRLIDTAGWLEDVEDSVDQAAIKAGSDLLAHAQLIIACSAPDARLPDDIETQFAGRPLVICASKSDLAHIDERAVLAVSSNTGSGINALREYIAEQLGLSASGEPRQQRCLQAVAALLEILIKQLPPDELLSDDLRQIADHLGDIIGITTIDDVMDVIFSSFCIGK